MPTHVNYDNMYSLLSGVIGNLKSKISTIDLTDQQKSQLSLIDKIIKNGTGTNYLSNDGTYKSIALDQMSNMNNELSVIYDLFKIDYTKGDIWSTNYNNMPTSRIYFGCVEYNGKIYCIGGYPLTNIVEVYDIGYQSYNITLPSDITNKLLLLITNGTGNKLLTDNGTYQEYIPSGYREMNSDEMNTLVNFINTSF